MAPTLASRCGKVMKPASRTRSRCTTVRGALRRQWQCSTDGRRTFRRRRGCRKGWRNSHVSSHLCHVSCCEKNLSQNGFNERLDLVNKLDKACSGHRLVDRIPENFKDLLMRNSLYELVFDRFDIRYNPKFLFCIKLTLFHRAF